MTSPSLRRGAVLRLGVLSTLLVIAGALPWTGGPMAARMIALPLLVVGVFMAAVTVRLGTGPLAARTAPARAPDRPAGCANCTCGSAAECAADPTGGARDGSSPA